MKVVNDQVGSPTYTKDLAYAIKKLITDHRSLSTDYGIYHISNSGFCSWYEFVREIIQNSKVIPISSEESGRPARRPKFSVLDNSRYIKIVGEPLRPWQEALKEYLRVGLTGRG